MPWKTLSALAAALALTGAFAGQALAQRDDDGDRSRWIELGKRKVDMSNEKDVIKIGQGEAWWKERGFRRLYLVAERGEIRLHAIRLVYKDRTPYDNNDRPHDDFEIKRTLKEGENQEIKLRGDSKYVKEVQFLYRSNLSFDGAVLTLYGVPSRSRGDGAEVWLPLGCKHVANGVDRDTIRVGSRDGRYRAIRLLGEQADVHILDLWVVYDGGEPDQIQVRSLLRKGDRTRALDLRGRERAIDRIEMTYERANRGGARVCVEGLR
jgi:hypothetical protein